MSEQETGYAGRPLPPPASDADVIVAIRHELWQASQGRGFGEDRTLVAMVRRVISERDEARENRKGEFELRSAAEQRLTEVEAERDKANAAALRSLERRGELDAELITLRAEQAEPCVWREAEEGLRQPGCHKPAKLNREWEQFAPEEIRNWMVCPYCGRKLECLPGK